MRPLPLPGSIAALVAILVALMGACNNGTGDCPAKESIQAGGACSDDNLQCAYDLATPSPACDGTSTTIPSSCICTKGSWSCPSPVSCESPGGDDAGAESSDEETTEAGEDSGLDVATEVGGDSSAD